jgi:hypothetical protein
VTTKPRSPSDLRFGALLVYSPSGTDDESIASRKVVRHIKNCRPDYIDRVAQRTADAVDRRLFEGFFGPDVILVPAPRSVPPDIKNPSWPARAICEALVRHGLCADVELMLERYTSVPKSALLRKSGERPGPELHAATIRAPDQLRAQPRRVTIVDDVVTRGSTLLGCAWVLTKRFPASEVCAFAAVRTMSGSEVEAILDPVDNGRIVLHEGSPRRTP